MDEQTEFDVVVVGAGATGGWAAKTLTERGLSVLVLDAGPMRSAAETRSLQTGVPAAVRPAEAWQARRKVQARYPLCNSDTQHLFIDDVDNPYTTPDDKPFDWIRSRQVGGRTLLWGGVTYRMSDLDFKAASHDGFDRDWPISYRDVEPFYDEVETFLRISGTAEGLAVLPDSKFAATPTMTSGELTFKHAVERRWGDRRVTTGRAIIPDPRPELDPDWRVLTSIGSSLAAARATGRVHVRPSSVVRKILIDANTAKARGVAFVDAETFAEREVRSKAVVLAASTIESNRVLWNSACDKHPAGIGNSTDMLGRFLTDHTRVGILGVCPSLPAGDLGPRFFGSASICVPRFRNVTEPQPDFLRGYQIVGAIQREGLPMVGTGQYAPFALSLQGEQLPRFESRVTIAPHNTDAWGIPVVHIECAHSDNERRMAADALECAREMIAEAKFEIATEYPTLVPPGWMIDETGGARMGDDPRISVVNRYNQVWDCPNVFVTDGACWVSSGCQNPTLTMMALAVRACRFLADELR